MLIRGVAFYEPLLYFFLNDILHSHKGSLSLQGDGRFQDTLNSNRTNRFLFSH